MLVNDVAMFHHAHDSVFNRFLLLVVAPDDRLSFLERELGHSFGLVRDVRLPLRARGRDIVVGHDAALQVLQLDRVHVLDPKQRLVAHNLPRLLALDQELRVYVLLFRVELALNRLFVLVNDVAEVLRLQARRGAR